MTAPRTDIILIGPVRAGKSTLARLLSEKLSWTLVSLDELRRRYYREIGYDDELAVTIRREGGFLALAIYWQLFDAYAVERVLAEHQNCVFDFGAGAGPAESTESFVRVQRALAPYLNVVLLLPSPDIEESLRILKARDAQPPADLNYDINRHFLERGFYQRLACHTVYSVGKTPEESRDEILATVGVG
jgi:shikimate kinase